MTAERRAKAVQMRTAGLKWDVICRELGYKSAGAACTDVTRALRQAALDEKMAAEEHLRLNLDRLDRLLAAVWPKALAGDIKAVAQAESLVLRVSHLMGLDQLNRNSVGDGDIASLLGTMLFQLQARHAPAIESVDAEVVREIEPPDAEAA
ncbi:hypothetical protein [Nonomuraea basaltis]|uniref:hypothetical protein n=1 Tax=Nonomuraea basaltis TaxID=2495887 RepID=UPI001485F2C0|nr:hypothetical protein [Nonomuraea basaltis]